MKRLLVICMLITGLSVNAGVEVQKFDNKEREARYKQLINELRCLVCQNQTIADSNAGLAKTLRQETFRMINEGASDEEIIDFMVTRYGDFVLYKPPLKAETILLWFGPFILLAMAIVIAIVVIRRNGSDEVAVDAGKLEQARKLLDEKDINV